MSNVWRRSRYTLRRVKCIRVSHSLVSTGLKWIVWIYFCLWHWNKAVLCSSHIQTHRNMRQMQRARECDWSVSLERKKQKDRKREKEIVPKKSAKTILSWKCAYVFNTYTLFDRACNSISISNILVVERYIIVVGLKKKEQKEPFYIGLCRLLKQSKEQKKKQTKKRAAHMFMCVSFHFTDRVCTRLWIELVLYVVPLFCRHFFLFHFDFDWTILCTSLCTRFTVSRRS